MPLQLRPAARVRCRRTRGPFVSQPVVSIGLPVYNEARHLEAALIALRSQTYENVEIIACDNASTDGTLAILRRHAEQDARIRVEAAEHNAGASRNFLKALALAQGPYFMWASGHDLWDRNLVAECVAALESNPGASLAFASADWVDDAGAPFGRETGWTDTRGMDAAGRYFSVLWGNMHPILGVIRLERLRACRIPEIIGNDLVLLADLALRGDFLHVTGARWQRRELRHEADYASKLKRYGSSDFGMAQGWIARHFPLAALPVELARVAWSAPLTVVERLALLSALAPSLLLRYRAGRRANGR